MKNSYVAPAFKLSLRDPFKGIPARISYSQFSIYSQCPKRWELSYIKKLAPYTESIATLFGTAFHETLQEYIKLMFTKSVKEADWLDFPKYLTSEMSKIYQKYLDENNGEHLCTQEELVEYLEDGIAILEWIRRRRSQYLPTKNMELLGIEIDLCTPASDTNNSVYWYGFLDLVFRDKSTNTIIIKDIKTSRQGWNKYQKADKLKAAQLVAYKKYFSKQFGVLETQIDVEFLIVKRKIQDNSMFPQKRVQIVKPSSGTVTMKKVQKEIDKFIKECFNADGSKNVDNKYIAIAGKANKNCNYCPFKTDEENCPKENRMKE